ncbi:hypothetical protein V3472_00970 [Lacticaseibacillus rhamnosus]
MELLSKRDEATLSAIEAVENIKAHPERPRKRYAGELVQMDASCEHWFGTQKPPYTPLLMINPEMLSAATLPNKRP